MFVISLVLFFVKMYVHFMPFNLDVIFFCFFFFFKQKTAYEIVSRDWSSDVCSSDLAFVIKTCFQTSNSEFNGSKCKVIYCVCYLDL